MKNKTVNKGIVAVLIAICMTFCACASIGLAKQSEFESNYASGEETPDIYVSSADVIFKSVDTENSLMEFYVLGTNEIKVLSYTGGTAVFGKHDEPMSVSMLMSGDIAKITYNSTLEKLGSVSLSENVFTNSDIEKYSLSDNQKELHIGDDIYSINDNIHIFSGNDEITIDQLINHDKLTISGVDHDLLSIRVDKGHGYLELDHEDALVGGWIEIGQTVISQVTDDMLFTVPEGDYKVRLTNNGIEEYRQVSISRNKVTTLDLSDIVSTVPEKGVVGFRIAPDTATSYVDGKFVDTSYAVRLPLGIHEITVSAPGYSTETSYFEVTGLNQVVEIELMNSTSSVSENTVNKNLYANIIVEAPYGVEVYEDNIYKGVVPVSYQKTSGTHTLTLRKTGYVPQSYTIIVYDDGKDQRYSFADLTLEQNTDMGTVSGNGIIDSSVSQNSVSQNSVSGNSVSGNSVSANSL